MGINALDALLLALGGIAALRQQLPSDVRIHYIVTDGGKLPQVIPDQAAATLVLRANDEARVRAVMPRIVACIEGAARMTGAEADCRWPDAISPPLRSNRALAAIFAENLGRTVRPRDELSGAWSGDTNAISWHLPVIQPQIAMTLRDVPPHSHEFHAASVGAAANRCILDAATAMAATAVELMASPEAMAVVRAEADRKLQAR